MTPTQLGLASALGAIAAVASFFATKPMLTAWAMHDAHGDGQSGLGVVAGSLFAAVFFGAITFGLSLRRGRRRS